MSFYISLSGLRNAQAELGAISHNIANVETNGFKRSQAEFADLVAGGSSQSPKRVQGIGSVVTEIRQDFGLGGIEQTGNSTDIAINGNGFFTTRDENSGRTLYTRDGAFGLDGASILQDGIGNRLQMHEIDASGAIVNPGTTIDAFAPPVGASGASISGVTVSENGTITAAYADGTTQDLGRVAMALFQSPTGLRSVGSSAWEATGLSGPPLLGQPGAGDYGSILSGTLERSNVDLAEEMLGLISAQRNFQANAKAIDTATQISQTIINLRT